MSEIARVVEIAHKLPEELQKAQLRGVRQSALFVTRGIRAQIRVASGGDNRLSGVGRRKGGARVGAKYDVKGRINPTAIISAKGPLHFLEHPVSPHLIDSKKIRRGKKGALKLADGSFRRSVNHPGNANPSRPFEKGYLATRDESGVIYDRQIQAAIRKVLV